MKRRRGITAALAMIFLLCGCSGEKITRYRKTESSETEPIIDSYMPFIEEAKDIGGKLKEIYKEWYENAQKNYGGNISDENAKVLTFGFVLDGEWEISVIATTDSFKNINRLFWAEDKEDGSKAVAELGSKIKESLPEIKNGYFCISSIGGKIEMELYKRY